MKKIVSQEEQRQIQLDILLDIDDFCKKNDIDYSIAFGTLLGAVRHHGFIPWDDDIDIMMTRENYERFRGIYNSNRYALVDLKNDKTHPVSMGKIFDSRTYFYYKGTIKRKYGLFVDVFPLDVIPEQKEIRTHWLRTIKRYIFFNQCKNDSFPFILNLPNNKLRLLGCIAKFIFFSSFIHNKLEFLYKKYNHEKSAYLGVPAIMVMSKDYSNKFFPRELFNEYTSLEFEGFKFQCIKGYDEFLSIFYGDYMMLPPIEKRKGKHGIVAYYK